MTNALTSFVVPSTRSQYRMGFAFEVDDETDFWWNRQLDDGTFTACEEPAGWNGLDYLTPLDQVGGRDGAFTGPPSVAPRILEITAGIVSPTPAGLHAHIGRLKRLLGPSRLPGPRPSVLWEQYEWEAGDRYALVCRPTGSFRSRVLGGPEEGGHAARITFQLVAANPVWKLRSGAVQSNQVGLLNSALVTGRTYDKTYNYTYGAGTSNPGGQMEVVNFGDLDTWANFTVTGAVNIPIITNSTTSQEFAINATLGSGEIVTIDGRTGVVDPANVRLIGRPFLLAPGTNTITWRGSDGVYHPNALLRMEWRSMQG